VLNVSKPLQLEWDLKSYEKVLVMKIVILNFTMSTKMVKTITGLGHNESEMENVSYIAYKQHFFSSILLTDNPFENIGTIFR
jgi:YidC/Oxa1 family membrane protein insertase